MTRPGRQRSRAKRDAGPPQRSNQKPVVQTSATQQRPDNRPKPTDATEKLGTPPKAR